jgi:2-polyprenyl-3-methyl-5-hydroxy-6-metoxy-1,4-benzoquinol methylase
MANKFSTRSYEAELLDASDIPKNLLFQNLRELDFINRVLGGHAVTLRGIKELMKDKNHTYRIVDIGCGGGDALKEIAQWIRKNGFKGELTGVDMNADCIEFMKIACKEFPEINGEVADYKDYLKQNTQIDIIHCSLFCHHLTDEQLIELFQYMQKHSRAGFVINDLHRNWFAYYSIMMLTRLLNGSSLVKNDAPVSVLRGFRKKELLNLLQKANVENATVQWKWAFRYLVLLKKSS